MSSDAASRGSSSGVSGPGERSSCCDGGGTARGNTKNAEFDAIHGDGEWDTIRGRPINLYVPRIGHGAPAELDAARTRVELIGDTDGRV
jgi:hypothetical protein